MQKRSWAAAAAGALGILGGVDALLGVGLASLGAIAPMRGFLLLGLGLLAALLAVVVGLVGIWRTREGSGRSGRSLAFLGAGIGSVMLGVTAFFAAPPSGIPRINDITTDLADPPSMPAAARALENAGRDFAYPPEFAPKVREAYPDLAPIAVAASPAEALEQVRSAAEELGWEIVEVRAGEGELEARDVSRLFRFVDDVSVRVRPGAAGGSVVDVRSKSRDGKSDLGANAERIRTLARALGS